MSIRFAQSRDLPAMLEIYRPYVLNTTYSFEYEPPTLEEFTSRFDTITAQYPWLVWEEAGKILGYAYASAPYTRAAYAWCAEPSIYLHPDAKGRGIGTKLYTALLTHWPPKKTQKASHSTKNFPIKNRPFSRTAVGNSAAG